MGCIRPPGRRHSEAEFDVVDVGEFDQEPVGTAAAVLEVLLLEAFGEDGLELLLRGAAACASKRRAA